MKTYTVGDEICHHTGKLVKIRKETIQRLLELPETDQIHKAVTPQADINSKGSLRDTLRLTNLRRRGSGQPNCVKEADTNQSSWRRLQRTQLPGTDTLQPIKLPASYAVSSSYSDCVSCHGCWDGVLSHFCSC